MAVCAALQQHPLQLKTKYLGLNILLGLFPPFCNFSTCEYTQCLFNFTFIFGRCRRSWAAAKLVKYGRDSNNLTGTFGEIKMHTEKLTNVALVTPSLVLNYNIYHRQKRCFRCFERISSTQPPLLRSSACRVPEEGMRSEQYLLQVININRMGTTTNTAAPSTNNWVNRDHSLSVVLHSSVRSVSMNHAVINYSAVYIVSHTHIYIYIYIYSLEMIYHRKHMWPN